MIGRNVAGQLLPKWQITDFSEGIGGRACAGALRAGRECRWGVGGKCAYIYFLI